MSSAPGTLMKETLLDMYNGINEIEQSSQEGDYLLPKVLNFEFEGEIVQETDTGVDVGVEKVIKLGFNYGKHRESNSRFKISGSFERMRNG